MNRQLGEFGSRIATAAVYLGLGSAAFGLSSCGSSKEATAIAGVRAVCPKGAELAVLGTEQPDASKVGTIDLSCMTPLDLNFDSSHRRLQPISQFPLNHRALEPGSGKQPLAGDLAIQYSYKSSDHEPFPGHPYVEFVEGDKSVLRVVVDDVTAIDSATIKLQ